MPSVSAPSITREAQRGDARIRWDAWPGRGRYDAQYAASKQAFRSEVQTLARTVREHRQLLAVLVGDIVAYSRLMSRKEADTFYRVKDIQTSVIQPSVARNRGRVVKWTGDGFIATFSSAVDAVRTAVEIQSGAAAAGAKSPEDLRLRFRMGVNVGDVIVAADDVYGDAVNIAVRLETAAPPDGICVSRGVRDAVSGKVGIDFENRGELEVKNIPEPVGAYGVLFDPVAWTMEPVRSERPKILQRRWVVSGAAAVLLLGASLSLAFKWNDIAMSINPQETLRSRLRSVVPEAGSQFLDATARAYVQAGEHKALAASVSPPGFWYTTTRANPEAASEAVLESCQVAYGVPCSLIATNMSLQPISASTRDMARARYSGNFAPAQIPAANASTRSSRDVERYATATGPKAIAYTPSGGRVFVIIGGENQRASEEKAFSACLADPIRASFNAPCFLYAVGNQVVLPLRRRDPLTGQSP
jgi:class 3 adenylate cyclase